MLDTGDAITGTGRYARIKADFYAQVFARMAYDAVGVGEIEAKLMSESGQPNLYGDSVGTVCANLVDFSTGKLLASKPYVVRTTKGGLKVGIISVVGEEYIGASSPGMRALPPMETVAKYMEELRGKSDFVIVISHGEATARRIAADVPGIDVILSGHSVGPAADKPEQIGSVIFMRSKSQGESVGKLALDIGEDGKITSFTGERAELNSDIKDDPEIVRLIDQQEQALRDYYASLATVTVGRQEPKAFVASAKCGECHAAEYKAWQATQHAKAFERLRKDNRTQDSDCLQCHATGFKMPGGFTSEEATPEMKGVQCESCHGTGIAHVRKPAKGYGLVFESTCKRCHTYAKSPDFEYNEYKRQIIHLPESNK